MYMKQLIITPSFTRNSYLTEVDISPEGVIQTRRKRLGKQLDHQGIAEGLQGYGRDIPIFVDPGFPDLIKRLRNYGYWILR